MLNILPIPVNTLFNQLEVRRKSGEHKGHFGHGLIVGGCAAMPGSAILAAQGAMRAGMGKLSVLMENAHQSALISRQPEVILADVLDIEPHKIMHYGAILLGPGLGQGAFAEKTFSLVMAHYAGFKVLDADALNWISQKSKTTYYDLSQSIITPHPGEAARLLGIDTLSVQADRPKAAQSLLAKYQCAVVVLKGANTLIAAKEVIYQCNQGSSAMSTAGMGDLLAGIILGLLGQGFSLLQAAQLGVYWHALAADQAVKQQGTISVLASDLLDWINLSIIS